MQLFQNKIKCFATASETSSQAADTHSVIDADLARRGRQKVFRLKSCLILLSQMILKCQ